MPRFVRELMEFLSLDEAVVETIRRTAPVVLRHQAALTEMVYNHFLEFPATARFFLDPDGQPDAERLTRRKHSLGRWLRETAEAAATAESSYSLLAVGLSHSHREHGPGGRVPAHFMVGTIGLVQNALTGVFLAECEDPREALRAAAAWNRLLIVHLAVLLLGYLPPSPA